MRDALLTPRTYRYTIAGILAGRTVRSENDVTAIAACVAAGSLSAITGATFGLFSGTVADDSCSITSGLKALTSPSNPWTAADVGKSIHVAGAGAAGAVLSARIAFYVSAGSIILDTAASTTVAATSTSAGGLAAWGDELTETTPIPVHANAAGTQQLAAPLERARGSTTARKVADRLAEVVNVKDFGAVGDGITDDAAAIRLAIAAATAANVVGSGAGIGTARATLVFPPGVYRVASTLTFDPFINYRGTRATTADAGGDFTDQSDSRGSVIRADPAIYTNNNATAGVLVFIATGDISIRDITFVGTATINANSSIGLQWGSSAAAGIGTRPHEIQAPMNVSGVDIQGCRFVAFVKAWEWNQVNDTYVSGCGFESNTTEIAHNRRECDVVFQSCTFFAFLIHISDTANATQCLVRYHGCTWFSDVPASSAWVFTQDHAIDIEVHGGPVQCLSRMLDIRSRVDTFTTRARFVGVRWLGAAGGGLQIERFSGGTAFDYDIEFSGCQFDACVVTLNIASRIGFVGCRFTGARILGSSNNPWLRIVGCIFRDLAGAAPVTVPLDSPYLVMVGNQFDNCTTAPSLSTHPTNTDWAVDLNSTSQAADIPVVRGSGGYASGAGSPVVAVLTPRFVGQEYLDTGTGDWWKSYGISSSTEWKKLTP